MLIQLPAVLSANVVSCLVCGITETLNVTSFTSATVRLTPSRHTEPFSTINFRIGASAFIVNQTAFSSGNISVITPQPST